MKIHFYGGGSERAAWDQFVADSKNGTFLFLREYMEYHADRFTDASLVIADDGGRPLALLPASRAGATVTSHAGLTYGGLVLGATATTVEVLAACDALVAHLRAHGVERLVYKTVPHIYHRLPAEEDRYALFRLGARRVRSDVLAVACPGRARVVQERRRRGVGKARRAGLAVRPSVDLQAFWRILEANLSARHQVRPVHTVEEMTLLRGRFPDHIRLFGAFAGAALHAGVLIYESARVAHAQYIAASEAGREDGALDLLFEHLISEVYREKEYFDFGISTEEGGQRLNEGLIAHKEGFGARAVVHDFYELDL
jgi:hypothetical protein